MAEIDVSGFCNLFENGVANIKQVVEDNKSSLTVNLKEVYDEDVALPITPSVAVAFDSSTSVLRAAHALSRRRKTYDMRFEVWYYHSELNENVRRKQVTEVAWQINNIFEDNITLNGFVPKLGSTVEVVAYRPRIRSGKIIASALIVIVARKLVLYQNVK